MKRLNFEVVDDSEQPDDERTRLEKLYGEFGVIVMPAEAQPPILTASVRAALHQWLYEINSAPELAAVGLQPRTRALLSGPPGTGKTTLAHHVAARLGMAMVVVQSAEMIGKYLGESGERLAKLFRRARKDSNVALFFDEFDALAKSRENLGGAGADSERQNITIALLQEFDRHTGMLFAATNMTAIIDPAIWRRFQLQIEIGLPGEAERFAIVKRYLVPFVVDDVTVAGLADAFDQASPALIKEGCEAIKRSLVLGPKMKVSTDLKPIMTRFIASAAAPEGMAEPLLWADPGGQLSALAKLPWPPVLAK